MKIADFEVGLNKPLFLIAGPCVIESEALVMDIAGELKTITQTLDIPFVLRHRLIKLIVLRIQVIADQGLKKDWQFSKRLKKRYGFRF